MSRYSQENSPDEESIPGENKEVPVSPVLAQKDDSTAYYEALLRCWENEKRGLEDQVRHFLGPKNLHEIRRSLRRQIRIMSFVGFFACFSPASRKNLTVISKVYRDLGPWRERDVLCREWGRLLQSLPEVVKCPLMSRLKKSGKREKFRRRKNKLSRVLQKIRRCSFPVCQSDVLTPSAESFFFSRLQKFFLDQDAKLEVLAERWGNLGPRERHQLRKAVRVLHESWELARKIFSEVPNGEYGTVLSEMDQCLGRVHDRDLSFGKLCRMTGFSGKKGWRRALLSGWYAGIAKHQDRQVAQLLKRYRTILRPWNPVTGGALILSDGSFPPG